jgi:hypothetical protein
MYAPKKVEIPQDTFSNDPMQASPPNIAFIQNLIVEILHRCTTESLKTHFLAELLDNGFINIERLERAKTLLQAKQKRTAQEKAKRLAESRLRDTERHKLDVEFPPAFCRGNRNPQPLYEMIERHTLEEFTEYLNSIKTNPLNHNSIFHGDVGNAINTLEWMIAKKRREPQKSIIEKVKEKIGYST